MVPFESRVVVVTGGGSGIGKSFCQGFAAEGARVAVADVAEEPARAVAREVDGLAVQVDVADPASTLALARTVLERFGRIDILINNAALWTALLPAKPWTEISVEEWDRVMAVNVRGSFLAARAVFPAMKERGWGRIVNMSSQTALSGVPGFLHYVTSKAALLGLTRALAREIGTFGITVNAIAPGMVSTPATRAQYSEEAIKQRVAARAIPREQLPQDLLGAVRFLASEEAGFVTGQVLTVDGGQVMY